MTEQLPIEQQLRALQSEVDDIREHLDAAVAAARDLSRALQELRSASDDAGGP